MAKIRKLKNGTETIYPVTHADAVWVSPSYKLSDFVGNRAGSLEYQNFFQLHRV